MVISWKVIKEEKKNPKPTDRLVPETQKGQHNRTKLLLTTTFTETKGLLGTKKHTIMCKASYLYNYIEISDNSLISFFSLFLTTVITVKWKKKRTAMLESIRSILHGNCSECLCIFFVFVFFVHFFSLFFHWRDTSANKMCCNSPKRKKIFQKVNIDTEV